MPESGWKAIEFCQDVGERELSMLAERKPTKCLRGEGLVCFLTIPYQAHAYAMFISKIHAQIFTVEEMLA